MMRLVQYDLTGGDENATEVSYDLIHNHNLGGEAAPTAGG